MPIQQTFNRPTPRFTIYLCCGILLYFLLNIFTQYSASKTADLDQAEQLILSQSLDLGYTAQPPLYTYLVKIAFYLTGPELATLFIIKALLLSTLLTIFLAIGDKLNFTRYQQLITVAGFVFIPQFIWESQRDLTHSVLATTIAAATLLQTLRIRQRNTTINYIYLGILVGLGVISKYNYIFFIFALFTTALLLPQYRLLIKNKFTLLTLLIALTIASPHITWAMQNYDIAVGSMHKLHPNPGNPFTGLTLSIFSAVAFLSPLWIFSLIPLSANSLNKFKEVAQTENGKFFLTLLVSTFILVCVFVITTGAQQIKDRWYQPLLFYTPILVALFSSPYTSKKNNWFISIAAMLAIIVSIALPGRSIFAERFNSPVNPNIPYPTVMQSIFNTIEKPNFILAETNLIGGNSRPFFPDTIILNHKHFNQPRLISGYGIVICNTYACENEKFTKWLETGCAIDLRLLEFKKIEAPYFYFPSKKLSLFWSPIYLASPCKL